MNEGESSVLFTYGSLMFEPVWQRVTGLTDGPAAKPRPARLGGFRRHAVADETYPALLRSPGSFVDGALYQQVPPDIMMLLDGFEGSDYQRIKSAVVLTDGSLADPLVFEPGGQWPHAGQTLDADVYLFLAADQALPSEWSVSRFAESGMVKFMAQYVGFYRQNRES